MKSTAAFAFLLALHSTTSLVWQLTGHWYVENDRHPVEGLLDWLDRAELRAYRAAFPNGIAHS